MQKKENTAEIELDVDRKHHKYFLAKRGQVLRQISEDFGGVTVSFPRINEDSNVVRIKGPQECVQGAKSKMEEIVSDLVSLFYCKFFIVILFLLIKLSRNDC